MNTDTLTIFLFVVGALVTAIGTLTMWILNDIRREVRGNSHHLERMVMRDTITKIRLAGVEKNLVDRHDYTPPISTNLGRNST